MAQQCVIAGVVFNDVPAVDIPDSNNVLHSFLDTTIASNAAAASDIASGKLAYVNGSLITGTSSGGGGIGTLLKTQALGNISTSNTTAEDTGIDLTITNVHAWDVLIVVIAADSQSSNAFCGEVNIVYLYNSTNALTKNSRTVIGAIEYFKKNSYGTMQSRYNSSRYGIYLNQPSSSSFSGNDITFDIYKRYNNTYTGTINDSFTAYVYGINIINLL